MRAVVSTLFVVLFGVGLLAPSAHASPGRSTKPTKRGGTEQPAQAKGAKAKANEPPRSKTKSPSKRKAKPCAKVEAEIGRSEFAERQVVELLDCDGKPTRSALEHLSKLGRHRSAARPSSAELEKLKEPGASGRKGVALLDPGLVERLAALTRRFPGRAIDVVSGYRPDSDGSQHQRARALDVVVGGVDNRTLFEACKDLVDTGCGYYPNSSFVHVDVRPKGLGTSWIDASGPGQSPRYVARWSDGAVAGPKPVAGSTERDAPAVPKPTVAAARGPALEAPKAEARGAAPKQLAEAKPRTGSRRRTAKR